METLEAGRSGRVGESGLMDPHTTTSPQLCLRVDALPIHLLYYRGDGAQALAAMLLTSS